MAISRKISKSLAVLIIGISIVISIYMNPERPKSKVNIENAEEVFEDNLSQYHKTYRYTVLIDSTNITIPNLEAGFTTLFKEEKNGYKNFVIESPMMKTSILNNLLQRLGTPANYTEAVINQIPHKRVQTLDRLREKYQEHSEDRAKFRATLTNAKYGFDTYRSLIKEEDVKLDSLLKRIDDLEEGSSDLVMVTFTTKPAKSVGTKVRLTNIAIETIKFIAILSIITIILFYGSKLLNRFLNWFGVGSISKGYNYRGYYNSSYGRYGRYGGKDKKGKRKVKRVYKDKVTTDPDKSDEEEQDSDN